MWRRLHQLSEVHTITKDTLNGLDVRLEAIRCDLEPLRSRGPSQTFDELVGIPVRATAKSVMQDELRVRSMATKQ